MERLGLKRMAAVAAVALAVPAAAQNGSADQGSTTTITSSPKADARPPATQPTVTPAPAPATTPVPVTVEPAQPVVVAPPVQAPPPQQPVMIQPDVAYPNGFADPNDPFANDMAAANRNRQGFPWGLLGLLGLLGLIPLFRGKERVRTVYVERDDTPRRVVRERIEEE